MLKRFFTVMLGSIAGFWISLIVLFFVGLMCVAALVGKSFSSEIVTVKNSVLYLDLSGIINERYEPTELMSLIKQEESSANALNDILTSLYLAKEDKDIKGVYIDCGGSSLGIASREEIVKAIEEFKKSGKWVWAYADNYTQGDYFIATAADKLYLNPVGTVDVHGLAANVMFYKNLLDKLGVEMQVVKVGSFKSAVEPFLLTQMSDSSRLQTRVFLDNIWAQISSTIAENRGVSTQKVNQWADSLIFCNSARNILDAKAVTTLAYRHEVEEDIYKKLGLDKDEDDLPLVSPTDYVNARSNRLGKTEKKHIAVLFAVGDIVDTGKGGISAEEIVPEIFALAKDDNVEALVLRVNSGGGSAFASEQIWEALEQFKQANKPFYVSMGDYAASGGYYISCGADKIYADAGTLTGSIGIFGMLPCAKTLLTDKIGVNVDRVVTNPNADFPNPYMPMTESQRNAMQTMVEEGYDTFTSRVAEGRNMSQAEVKRIGEGRVWDGRTALKIGLVDEIGTLNKAIADIAKKVHLDATDYVCYPEVSVNLFDTLIRNAGLDASTLSTQLSGMAVNEAAEYLRILGLVRKGSSIEARMAPLTVE